jgi:cyclopropane-fatty-acyl-phospholipid synthase
MHIAHETTEGSPTGKDLSPSLPTVGTSPAVRQPIPEPLPAPSHLGRLQARLFDSLRTVVITLPDGRQLRCGKGPVVAHVDVKNSAGTWALGSLNEGNIARSYIEGDLDITGDFLQLLDLRSILSDRHYLTWAWRFLEPLLFGQTRTNARAISVHYDLDPTFYLSFLDETRCYTQGIFLRDDDPLHTAIQRKFDYCLESCRLAPGSHILEIGPGWGAFSEYATKRGIRITAITNSRKSEEFMEHLARRSGCKWQVYFADFLTYRPHEQYDAVVLMGIMEHLPQYDAVVRQFARLLRPGGVVYLDASAAREKYKASSFISREIYPANHSFFVLHDFLRAVSRASLQIRTVADDRHNYFLTFGHWARKFESQRETVVAEFGERNYRRFHLYLWASAHCFLTDILQCYRVVLDKPQAVA